MTRLQELEPQAGKLPEAERAALVSQLLATLPPVLADTDGGVAEARRRDDELNANPRLVSLTNNFRPPLLLPENDEPDLSPERPMRRLCGASPSRTEKSPP